MGEAPHIFFRQHILKIPVVVLILVTTQLRKYYLHALERERQMTMIILWCIVRLIRRRSLVYKFVTLRVPEQQPKWPYAVGDSVLPLLMNKKLESFTVGTALLQQSMVSWQLCKACMQIVLLQPTFTTRSNRWYNPFKKSQCQFFIVPGLHTPNSNVDCKKPAH